MSARVRFLAGGITGGHIGPPLHGVGSVWEPTGIGAERCLSRRGGTEPAPYRGSGGVRGGVWSPRPTGATQVVRSSGPMYLRHGFRRPNFVPKFGRRQSWASAPTGRRGSLSKHPGQRRTAERLRQRVRGNEWELRQRSSPKGPATSDNPSVSLRLTAPFTQGSLALRGTGVRAAVPRAWPPPTKFRAEIWGIGQVVGPYGKPNQPPKPAGAQRSVRASGREGWAGIDARTIPKGGPPRDLPGSA